MGRRPVAKGEHFGAVPPAEVECPPLNAPAECPPLSAPPLNAPRWMLPVECPPLNAPRWVPPAEYPTTTPPRITRTSPTTPLELLELHRLPPPPSNSWLRACPLASHRCPLALLRLATGLMGRCLSVHVCFDATYLGLGTTLKNTDHRPAARFLLSIILTIYKSIGYPTNGVTNPVMSVHVDVNLILSCEGLKQWVISCYRG